MTPDEVVFSTLLESGLPGTRVAWPLGGDPALPWFAYRSSKDGNLFADNSRYARMDRYIADLYQADYDDSVRDTFEQCVARLGPYSCSETWVPSENCWMTSYTFTYHPDE